MSKTSLRDLISLDLGIPPSLLSRLIARAPHSYKVYTIPKKTGGRRTIAQPAKETKYVQNWLIKNVFGELPIHSSATAYVKGSSIKENARVHSECRYLVKLDFKDYFTSIKDAHLKAHLTRHLGNKLSEGDIDDVVRVSCIRPKSGSPMCLSIGAPSSPLLSNTVMYEFDEMVSSWCEQHGVLYSRYADDMAFSTNEKGLSSSIEKEIRRIAKLIDYPVVRFNSKKTTHSSKKFQRRVTGIIINNDGKLSLGRARKRMISSLVHKFTVGNIAPSKIKELQGLLGFAKDVEPLFLARLRGKYGSKAISEILAFRKAE